MKVVIAYDLGEGFVKDLRASFPEVNFVVANSLSDAAEKAVAATNGGV